MVSVPRISAFDGTVITMSYRAHQPPHFYAIDGEHQAQIALATREPLPGRPPWCLLLPSLSGGTSARGRRPCAAPSACPASSSLNARRETRTEARTDTRRETHRLPLSCSRRKPRACPRHAPTRASRRSREAPSRRCRPRLSRRALSQPLVAKGSPRALALLPEDGRGGSVARYGYDYAGQDPINAYDLDGQAIFVPLAIAAVRGYQVYRDYRAAQAAAAAAARAARAATLQASKARHDALRDEIRDKLVAKGYTVRTEVTRSTTLGPRRVDIEFVNPARGKVYALELKTGRAVYSTSQRLKDGQLAKRHRYVNRVIRG